MNSHGTAQGQEPDAFKMEPQERTLWCWAAVAAAVHNFLDPEDQLTQEGVAERVLGVDCTGQGTCDTGEDLGLVLRVVGNLKGNPWDAPLTFDSIKDWIDHNLPICVRIVWYDNGGHCVVIDGYRELGQTQLVHVQDPLYGPSWQWYDALVEDYAPGGSWQTTYLLRPTRNIATAQGRRDQLETRPKPKGEGNRKLISPKTFPSEIETFLATRDLKNGLHETYLGRTGRTEPLSSLPTLPTREDVGLGDFSKAHHDPHSVFVLGLRDVFSERGLQAAKPAGWIFFAGTEDRKTVIGRVSHRAHSRMTALYHDERAWQLLNESRALEELDAVKRGSYERRLLTVPGLNLIVFWLVALDPKLSDLVVPVAVYPKPDTTVLNIPKEECIEAAHFLPRIRPLAEQRLRAPKEHVG